VNNFQKHKRHWSFVVTDKIYLYPIVAIISVFGIFYSIHSNDPTFFQRIGNFVIGIGVWMSLRYTLREGINSSQDMKKQMPSLPTGGKLNQINPALLNKFAFSIGDAHLQLHGFFLVIYGSIIGSFGDYIVKLIQLVC
jgi:hypothetical protein